MMIKKKSARIKDSVPDKIFDIFNYVFLTLCLIVVVFPLMHVLSCSLSGFRAIYAGEVLLLPKEFTLATYRAVFEVKEVWIGYRNTIFYTFVGTLINVVMTILLAYPLSRKDLMGRRFFTMLFMFTMFFSGGLIPLYMVVKNVGLVGSMWALILPTAISIWNVIITRTFFQSTIPGEMLEAAKIDGCSDFNFILRIVLPLSKTIIAVNVLFYAVAMWNSYMPALLYLNDQKTFPLQLILRKILLQSSMDSKSMSNAMAAMSQAASAVGAATQEQMRQTIKYALIIVASLPVLILYPFVQKYFVKGVTIGSVKG